MFQSALPYDLQLHVLSFLTIRDVVRLYTLSKEAHRFFVDHEDALFYQLAVRHRFVRSGVTLRDAVDVTAGQNGYWFGGVESWKDLCKQHILLERNWAGREHVVIGGYTCYDSHVSSFRVDEQRGLMLVLLRNGTLLVHMLDDPEVPWRSHDVLSVNESDGYLLIGRATEDFEVWRHTQLVDVAPLAPSSPLAPLDSQLDQLRTDSNGLYVPHAALRNALIDWRARTLRGNILAAVPRHQPHTIHLYDLLRGELRQIIDINALIRNDASRAAEPIPLFAVLSDIQLSDEYVCVCFDAAVVLVPLRQDTRDAASTVAVKTVVVYRDPFGPLDMREISERPVPIEGRHTVDDGDRETSEWRDNATTSFSVFAGRDAMAEYAVGPPKNARGDSSSGASISWHSPCYTSAKFSPDGRNLVIGSAFGLIIFLPDVRRLFTGGMLPKEIVERLNVTNPIRDIQWEGQNRRFAFRNEDDAHFIVDLSPRYHDAAVLVDDEPVLSLRNAALYDVRPFSGQHERAQGNMLLRRTGLWLVWKLPLLYGGTKRVPEQTVCFASFAPS